MLAVLGKTVRQVDHLQYGRRADRADERHRSRQRPRPVQELQRFRGEIAIVFQGDRLLPWRTALANVELGLEIFRHASQGAARHRAALVTKLGLDGHERDFPHALSGGMRQRVSIARAFATNASILLCDEPFSALDEITANRLRGEFLKLVKENGKTAVFITHSINEALQIGDRIVVLKRPAKIAYDVNLANATAADKQAIRERIEEILSA